MRHDDQSMVARGPSLKPALEFRSAGSKAQSGAAAGPRVALWVQQPPGQFRAAGRDEILEAAQRLLARRVRRGRRLPSSALLHAQLQIEFGRLKCEVFVAWFLDAHQRILARRTLFRGTVDRAVVYPREVVREALGLNASSLILVHNHVGGSPQPSGADKRLTQVLKSALALVDVQLVDHLVVTAGGVASMAALGHL